MNRTRKAICVVAAALLATGLAVLVASYYTYRRSGSYPWEYLIEKEVRLQRVESRTRARLLRLVGSSRDAVLAEMGQPTKTEQSIFPRGPFWGPQMALFSILKPDQAFEEWQYQEGMFTYLIWFAGAGEGASNPNEWKVVGTGTHREGVVY